MSEHSSESDATPNLFDVIAARAWETVEFHCVAHQITLSEDERDAVQLGLASAVHVAIEQFAARASGYNGEASR